MLALADGVQRTVDVPTPSEEMEGRLLRNPCATARAESNKSKARRMFSGRASTDAVLSCAEEWCGVGD